MRRASQTSATQRPSTDQPAGMLAIARALVQQPRVLLIDVSMGLAPVIVESLMPVVRAVADETDAAVVLVHGDVTLLGPAAAIRADSAGLEAAYLGKVS